MGFCFALAERQGGLFPEFQRVRGVLIVDRVSLTTMRATQTIHTLGPPTVHFWPKLSAVSLSLAAWVIGGLCALFRSQPPGVGFREMVGRKSKWQCPWVIDRIRRPLTRRANAILILARRSLWT